MANPMLEWAKGLTLEETRAFIRRVEGPLTRKLEGDEYDQTWTMLNLIEPASSSNNQRTWTDTYIVGSQDAYDEYHVTWWSADEKPEITVIVKDEENA